MAYPSNAGKKTSAGKGAGSSSVAGIIIWLLTRIALPLVVLYGVLWWRADSIIEKQFEELRTDSRRPVDIRRGSTVLSLNGDIGIKDLVVQPLESSDAMDISVKAERLVLHTPGLWWLVRSSVLGIPKEIPSRFGFSVENVEVEGSDEVIEALIEEGHSFNVLFPFDLAGCAPKTTLEALKGLGLDKAKGNVDITMTHPNSNDIQLRISVSGSTQASMDAEINIELASGQNIPMRLATGSLRNIKVNYIDQGYMEKRNEYCAKHLAVTPEQFLELHSAAVRQWFTTEKGLLPGVAMTQAYSRFAKVGGTLAIQARPLEPGPLMAMRGLGLHNLAAYLNVTVQHDDDFPAPLVFLQADDYQVAAAGTTPHGSRSSTGEKQVKLVSPGQEILFADLSNYLGARVSVATRNNTVRRGIVEGASSVSFVITLDASDGGGYLLTLPRNSVEKIILLTSPPSPASSSSSSSSSSETSGSHAHAKTQ